MLFDDCNRRNILLTTTVDLAPGHVIVSAHPKRGTLSAGQGRTGHGKDQHCDAAAKTGAGPCLLMSTERDGMNINKLARTSEIEHVLGGTK